jgi:glycosyltransferase involved in cell wall biosynthesis
MGERRGFLRWCVKTALKTMVGLSNSTVLVQNHDDQGRLVREGIVPDSRTEIIAGSGVDEKVFSPKPPPFGIPIVLLPARMLWDKGIGDFVEAARVLQRKGVSVRCVLVGRQDDHNPAAISKQVLAEWVKEGAVEWWGHREDMPAVYEAATLIVLPSYREGLPKVLLEAAACGKAIVATDVPGCREIVRDRFNGLSVPPRNCAALAAAIDELLSDHPLREMMGERNRKLAVEEWSVSRITGQILGLYREVLKTSPAERSHG